MDDVISFDIETVPQRRSMSKKQKELYKKLMQSQMKKAFPDGYKPMISEIKKVRGLVMATTPYLGEIVVIGMHRVRGNESASIALIGTEKEILERFWDNLRGFTGLFVSFNGLDFDVPFIVKRSMYHGIKPTNNNFIDLKRFSKWPHFDVKQVMGNWDKFATGNLDMICDFLNIPSPKEGEVKAADVEQACQDGRIDEVGKYCVRDTVATYLVYDVCKDYSYRPNAKI